jgi:hypothetical protein
LGKSVGQVRLVGHVGPIGQVDGAPVAHRKAATYRRLLPTDGWPLVPARCPLAADGWRLAAGGWFLAADLR